LKALIVYFSYSGNTEEVAEHIASRLKQDGWVVHLHHIGYGLSIDPSGYHLTFIGTFTWDYGEVPDEVEAFIAETGTQLENVAVFGTGDTQFGPEMQYCKAVDELVSVYQSKWPGLKIEQSPRGMQEKLIDEWLEGVLDHVKNVT